MMRTGNHRTEVPVSDYEQVEAAVEEDGVAVVTLARPDKRNALSIKLRGEVSDVLAEWAEDESVRVVILTGAGPAFSAGFDLKEFGQPELARRIRHNSTAYHRAVWNFPKPIVAAVNGPAMGGGFDLALLCDMRVASSAASFGHPEIKFGAPPLFTPLRWIVGDGVARDLCLTGRPIGADEAQRIGLVSRVVAPDALMDEARAVARQIAEAPQAALQTTKRYLSGNQGLGFEESFRIEHDDVFDRLLTGGAPAFG
jgi:enoyl-CoA hydratase